MLACSALLVSACGRAEQEPASSGAAGSASSSAREGKAPVEIVPAPAEGDVAELVRNELSRAARDRRRLVVYVGATWCEPCRRFRDAAAEGQLDRRFPGLRLLELDMDRDQDRLSRAGYAARMVPLFVVPRPDGTASDARIEGSVKGSGAVANIAPRLEALLDRAAGRAR